MGDTHVIAPVDAPARPENNLGDTPTNFHPSALGRQPLEIGTFFDAAVLILPE
jgi:hypothetical protein